MPSSRKRQTRLSFNPLPSSSPASQSYPSQIRDRAAAVTIEGRSSPVKRRKLNTDPVSVIPTPSATLQTGDDSDSEPVRGTQRRGPTQKLVSSPDSPNDKLTSRSQRTPAKKAKSGMFNIPPAEPASTSAMSDSDSSEGLPSVTELSMQRKSKNEQKKRGRRRQNQAKPPVHPSDNDFDEDEDDIPTSTARKRRKQRESSRSSFVSSSPPIAIDSDSDDDVTIVDSAKRVQTEDKSDEPASGALRSRKPNQRPRHVSQQEKTDLAEDLDFIGHGSDSDRDIRSTQSAKKDARREALERLKQRRSGVERTAGDQPETTLRQRDSDDERNHEEEDDDLDVLPSSRQMFERDDEDDDFLEDDEDGDQLGVPDDIPIAFTSFASQKPKNLFIYAVDWFVQKKINPAFNMSGEIYILTFKKLDDEIRGLAGSKFTSSAWTSDFITVLNARPEIAVDGPASFSILHDKCDACNRTGHPATYTIAFSGKPYHSNTLEEVSDDEDDEDTEEEDTGVREEFDAEGRPIVPESTVFYVGKFCTANAQTAHALRHWRYHLNEWIETWLSSRGYLSAGALVARDRLSTKKRQKEAKKIVDAMVEEGVVKRLWREFRNTADTARSAKQSRFGGSSP